PALRVGVRDRRDDQEGARDRRPARRRRLHRLARRDGVAHGRRGREQRRDPVRPGHLSHVGPGGLMRRIGLIGGTTWTSTVEYYRLLNEGVAARLGGLHSADVVLRSLEFGEISTLQKAGDWPALERRYRAEAELLVAAGAEVIGICANTMHLVFDEVVAGAGGAQLVHVVDEAARAAREIGAQRLGLLGTAYTMRSDLYQRRLEG